MPSTVAQREAIRFTLSSEARMTATAPTDCGPQSSSRRGQAITLDDSTWSRVTALLR